MLFYKTNEEIVKPILEAIPATRDNDATLYIEYCRAVNPTVLSMRFEDVLEFRKRLNIASIETIGRVRRKLQAENPSLRASASAENDRYEKWKETIDYATS